MIRAAASSIASGNPSTISMLGCALLEKEDIHAAAEVIGRIRELDASSFERNVQCAALLAGICREENTRVRRQSIARES